MIDRDDMGFTQLYDVVADALGNVIVVWSRTVGETSNVWVNRLDGSRWSGPLALDAGEHAATRPSVEATARGDALSIWEQSNGSRIELWSRRFD